jgi:hypothetical protein
VLDDGNRLLPPEVVEEYAAASPEARVEDVPDVNHYNILLGAGGGAGRVAEAVRSALDEA